MGGDIDRIDAAEAAGALAWWLESGVDIAVVEQPRNWLAPKTPAVEPSAPGFEKADEQAVPDTLDLFRDWLATSENLPLASAAVARALPQGDSHAEVMLLAEMPTRDDVAEGRPISGPAWQLVERMMAAIGIGTDACYSASLSCFHAPGTRIPRDLLEPCAALARRHIALAAPKRLLLLGEAPSIALLGKPLAAARGHVHKVEGIRTVVTFHPRFLMSQPSNKALAWRDLLLLMEDEA